MAGENGLNGHTKTVQLKRAAFLAAYAMCGNISGAARAAGVERMSHYNEWLKDPDYVAAFEAAQEQATQNLESEARRRAEIGLQRVITHKGKVVMVDVDDAGEIVGPNDPKKVGSRPLIEHEYSDTLMIFLLKGLRPKVYRDAPPEQNVLVQNNVVLTIPAPRALENAGDAESPPARQLPA